MKSIIIDLFKRKLNLCVIWKMIVVVFMWFVLIGSVFYAYSYSLLHAL